MALLKLGWLHHLAEHPFAYSLFHPRSLLTRFKLVTFCSRFFAAACVGQLAALCFSRAPFGVTSSSSSNNNKTTTTLAAAAFIVRDLKFIHNCAGTPSTFFSPFFFLYYNSKLPPSLFFPASRRFVNFFILFFCRSFCPFGFVKLPVGREKQ